MSYLHDLAMWYQPQWQWAFLHGIGQSSAHWASVLNLDVHFKLGERSMVSLYYDDVLQPADHNGVTPMLKWPWWLGKLLGFSGLAHWWQSHVGDLRAYFLTPGIRQQVWQRVWSQLQQLSEPCVVVAHSLGSVVILEALKHAPQVFPNVRGVLTLGSPLGHWSVLALLAPGSHHRPWPAGLPWVNVASDNDVVSSIIPPYLGCNRAMQYRLTGPNAPNHALESYARYIRL